MIDTHCHIDLYKNPVQIATECEKRGIITIGMTNLPSHFVMGYPHLLHFKKVRLALGMHPLYANRHAGEWETFTTYLDKTSYIGEVGLDFSREGISTMELQVASFKKVLALLKDKKKLLSLHSRRAEKEVLEYLCANNITSAIFHWYSGPLGLIKEIIKAGYYFSVNTAMIVSEAGRKIIAAIPPEFIVTESDGPFIDFKTRPVKPADLGLVEDYLAKLWQISRQEASQKIFDNFRRLLDKLV